MTALRIRAAFAATLFLAAFLATIDVATNAPAPIPVAVAAISH